MQSPDDLQLGQIVPYSEYRASAGANTEGVKLNNRRNERRRNTTHAENNRTARIPDLLPTDKLPSAPNKYKGFVMRKRRGFFHFARKYVGVLDNGVLKLKSVDEDAKKKHKLHAEFLIELDKVVISYNDKKRHFMLIFRKESHMITPVDRSTYVQWKDAFINHRRFRQGQLRAGLVTHSDQTVRITTRPTANLADNHHISEPTKDTSQANDESAQLMQQSTELNQKIRAVLESMKEIRSCIREQWSSEECSGNESIDDDTDADEEETEVSVVMPENSHKCLEETRNGSVMHDKNQPNSLLVQVISLQQEMLSALNEAKQMLDDMQQKAIKTAEEMDNKTIPPAIKEQKESAKIDKRDMRSMPNSSKLLSPSVVVSPQVVPSSEIAQNEPLFMPPSRRRTVLPAEQPELKAIPYSAVLRAKLPMWAYEPVGTLQVICEELQFASQILDHALNAQSASIRICYVAAFVMSSYTFMATRKQKPFNPVIGETFEYISDQGWKYHAEQVSHRPPVSVAHAEHDKWEWSSCVAGEYKITLQGNAEITYKFPIELKLTGINESYKWSKAKTIIVNPLKSGSKRAIRNEGTISIQCSNGHECQLQFTNGSDNSVSGKVYDGKRNMVHRLAGVWNKELNRVLENGGSAKLFEAPAVPKHLLSRFYGFSPFTITLNELHANHALELPPTDSRYRPDQKFFEMGDTKKAADAKEGLEKNQRKRESSKKYTPVWFEPGSPQGSWSSNHKYWPAKLKNFQDDHSKRIPKDIFDVK
ncbi:oxysterol-binding protein domain-containing protein [Ditylenchus destructor]|uniref:Oxysterol-binding protein domain-containing protein n=1 Tax=Ditylenchus destructor TaxID=166010 RepID=A0AAD4MU08_9BILA|nr:oxysterol-binding protein domain-containing protein [Ditylenchus destructor]